MNTKSAKAKGRRLQDWVAAKILHHFPSFTKDDVRPAIMGETGADIKLSMKVMGDFPYQIECKNQEGFKKVYDAYEQAKTHGGNEPLLIIKSNRRQALAIVDAAHFISEAAVR